MEADDILLPALKSTDWPGREQAICRPLIADVKLPGIPWVSFVYDRPHTFEFITRNHFPASISREQIRMLEQAALRNLKKRPAIWTSDSAGLGLFKRMRLLTCNNDFLAAEHILDPDFLLQAHSQLRAHMLVVGIPCRGLLLATSANQPQELVGRFCAMVSTLFYRAPSAPISPEVFSVSEGAVIGMITGMEDAGKRLALMEEEQHPGSVKAQLGVDRESGAEMLFLMVACQEVFQIDMLVISAFIDALYKVRFRPAFGGQVQVIILPEFIADSPQLQELMPQLAARLAGIARETYPNTFDGKPVQVSVQYGQQE